MNNAPLDWTRHRVQLDPESKETEAKTANNIVDEIYTEIRDGVDWEIDQVDKLFFRKNPDQLIAEEVELINLVDEKMKREEQR